jgi:hypothetical protein
MIPSWAMAPTEERFREVFNAVEPYIERRYGVPVIISDVVNPFTGDLDGKEILIDHDLTAEEATFILVHLFGHTVQWNRSTHYRDIGSRAATNPTPEHLEDLHRYELEACRYSVQLFHDVGVKDLDQWLSDFAACDFAYLRHFYATGEKKEFRSFWKDGQPLLEPLAIPEFQPTRWVSRWQGTVV